MVTNVPTEINLKICSLHTVKVSLHLHSERSKYPVCGKISNGKVFTAVTMKTAVFWDVARCR
jgi:hypothetical protein